MKIQDIIGGWMIGLAIVGLIAIAPVGSFAQETEQAQETTEDSVEDLMRDAQRAAQQGDLDTAIELIEKAVKKDDENFELKLILANVLQQHGMMTSQDSERADASPLFMRSAEVARIAMDKHKDELAGLGPQINGLFANIFYNEACTLALNDKKDAALASLKEAFELGFSDFELAATDEDFASINESSEFTSLLESQKKAAVERLATETREEMAAFESFDFDFDLEDVKGESVALSDFKGKVLIVDFWGTWCPPCRAEIPSFVKLKNKFGEKGFDIVGLNQERTDDEAEAVKMITDFMDEYEMNYRCALVDEDTMGQVDIQGFPTTLFIDATGKVRHKLVGLHDYEKLESIVVELMKESEQE